MIRKIQKYLICLFIVFSLLFLSLAAIADDSVEILPIKSVPDLKIPGDHGKENPAFNGQGTIQRVGEDEVKRKLIVIDDRLMYFADAVIYYDIERTPTSYIKFYKGKTVGYFFNKKREITKLYLIYD